MIRFIIDDLLLFVQAMELFKEVRANAIKAFNQTDNVEGWVISTELKITASIMIKSYEKGKMLLFSDLSTKRQSEIGRTIKVS